MLLSAALRPQARPACRARPAPAPLACRPLPSQRRRLSASRAKQSDDDDGALEDELSAIDEFKGEELDEEEMEEEEARILEEAAALAAADAEMPYFQADGRQLSPGGVADDEEYEDVRLYSLRELLSDALGEGEQAYVLHGLRDGEDFDVSGISSSPSLCEPGDLFVCLQEEPQAALAEVEAALDVGAKAMLLRGGASSKALADSLSALGCVFALVPGETQPLLSLLSDTLYDEPFADLTTVAVTGGSPLHPQGGARLVVSHLMKSILEATSQTVGLSAASQGPEMTGGVRLSARGLKWSSFEEDPCASRVCTSPGMLAPYVGRYVPPDLPPDALGLQQLAAGLLDLGGESCVMELQPSSILSGALSGLRFDVAIWACDPPAPPPGSQSSQAAWRDANEVSAAKRERAAAADAEHEAMVRQMEADSVAAAEALFLESLGDETTQRAVVCVDQPEAAARLLAAATGRAKVVTYSGLSGAGGVNVTGWEGETDVYPLSVELSIWDTLVTLSTPQGPLTLRSPLLGPSCVSHIAAAVAAGCALGVPLKQLEAGINACKPVPGQVEGVDEGQPFAVVVDSARSPRQLDALLRSVRECGALSVITVLGGGGEGCSEEERAAMGRTAHRLSEVVFVTTDDPGFEGHAKPAEEVVAGFDHEVYRSKEIQSKQPPWPFLKDITGFISPTAPSDDPWAAMQYQTVAKRFVIADRFLAVRAALGMASEGYVVVLAGKGAQDWQEVEGRRHWFSDAEEARAALRILPKKPKSLDMGVLPYRIADWPSDMNDFLDG